MAVCRYHPERQGIGVCVRCRSVICAACCTRVEGVNHCHACLRKLGRPKERPAPGRALAAVGAIGLLSVLCLFFFGVFWLIAGRLAP